MIVVQRDMKKRPWCSIIAILICFLACFYHGCSPPQIRETYEFHRSYDAMIDEFDPPVSRVELKPGANLSRYESIVVSDVSVGGTWIDDHEKAYHFAANYFRQVLAIELLEINNLLYVTLDTDFETDSPAMVIESKITGFDTGSGAGRYFGFFFFPLQKRSAVDLQVEGRIVDHHSGEVLVNFADRRLFLGYTPWGPTLKTWNEEWTVKQTCIFTARSISWLIEHLIEVG